MRHWRVTTVRLTSCELDVREGEEGRKGGGEGGEEGGEGRGREGRRGGKRRGGRKVSDNVTGLLQ